MATKTTTKQPVIVTTEHRGVFFGYLKGKPTKEKAVLTNCRNAVYWDSGTKGFMGLSKDGPGPGCRIGPASDEVTLFDITSVVTVTPTAAKKWEDAPWNR
jgi:hypothetical protein